MIDYELTGSYDPQGKGNFPAYLNYWTPENPSNDFRDLLRPISITIWVIRL